MIMGEKGGAFTHKENKSAGTEREICYIQVQRRD
jgi:hypothetical protein